MSASLEPSSQTRIEETMSTGMKVDPLEGSEGSPRQRMPDFGVTRTPERASSRAENAVNEESRANSYPSPPQPAGATSNDTVTEAETVKNEGDVDAAMLNANTDSSKGSSVAKYDKIPLT